MTSEEKTETTDRAGARGFARGGRAGGRRPRTDQRCRHERGARETPGDLPGKAKQDRASFQGAGQGPRGASSGVWRSGQRGEEAPARGAHRAQGLDGRGGPSLQERDRRDASGNSQGGRPAPPLDADHGGGQDGPPGDGISLRRLSRGRDRVSQLRFAQHAEVAPLARHARFVLHQGRRCVTHAHDGVSGEGDAAATKLRRSAR